MKQQVFLRSHYKSDVHSAFNVLSEFSARLECYDKQTTSLQWFDSKIDWKTESYSE